MEAPLSTNQQAVMDALEEGPLTFDEVCERIGLSRSVAGTVLASLQHRQYIGHDTDGTYYGNEAN